MKTPRNKILFIVQLPPPVHGASIMNENLVKSTVLNAYDTSVLNIVTAHHISSIGKFSLKKTFASILIFFKILGRLIFFRPQIVYFTLSPSGFAFYRDVAYIFLIKLFMPKLVFQLHGKGIQSGVTNSKVFRYLANKAFSNSYSIHMSELLVKDLDGISVKKKFIVPFGIPVIPESGNEKKGNIGMRFLFLSNYVKTKGILDLIDAFKIVAKKNREFHLDLVGKPYDVSEEELKECIRKNNLEELISVCGPKYNEEKYQALLNADVFVFPTYYFNEAFPIALLEAMQFGLPSITTKEGGIPDMIEDGFTGLLVDKRDVTALANRILLLLENSGNARSMGKNARSQFLKKYTLHVFEQNIAKTFEEIINDKK